MTAVATATAPNTQTQSGCDAQAASATKERGLDGNPAHPWSEFPMEGFSNT